MSQVILANIHEDKERWLKHRGIGSSDAATILGLNPYKTKHALWLELSGLVPGFEGNAHTQWGTRLEPVIASAYEDETGDQLVQNSALYAHDEYSWMTATPDYWLAHGKDKVVECKSTVRAQDYEEGIPDYVHCQVLHQMAVLGVEEIDVAALIQGWDFRIKPVKADKALIDNIVNIEGEFYRMVEDGTPPPLSASDGDILKHLYPTSRNSEVLLPDTALGWLRTYQEAAEQLKRIKEEQDLASTQLKALLRDNERGLLDCKDGRFVVSWKGYASKRFDSKTFAAKHPELHEEFLQTTTARRFNIKKEAE